MEKIMELKKHIERHKELHKHLDELIADYIGCTKKNLTDTTLMEFMEWSYKQTLKPS